MPTPAVAFALVTWVGILITTPRVTPAQAAPAPAAPPALAGVWELDTMMGAAPLGFPNWRAVCGAGSPGGVPAVPPPSQASPSLAEGPAARGAASESAGDDQMSPFGTFTAELTIEQTPTAVSIVRKYGGSVASGELRGRYALDGTESVNRSGDLTTRTRSRWEAGVLVTEGEAATRGRPGACRVRETIALRADATLAVTTTGDLAGEVRTSRQAYHRRLP